MIDFLLESSLVLGVSMLIFYLFFRREKYFMFIRFYLLGTLLTALLLPLIHIEADLGYVFFDDTHKQIGEGILGGVTLSEKLTNTTNNSRLKASNIDWSLIILTVYLLGVAVMACRFVKNVILIFRFISTSDILKKPYYQLVLLNKCISPFSFWNYVFVNKSDFYQNRIRQAILDHELVHVKQSHTLDNLVMELLLIAFYFHPLLWMYRIAIKNNHEYLADDYAHLKSNNIKEYVHHLIQYNLTNSGLLFESSFNYLSSKKRLIMLTKKKNGLMLFVNKAVVAMLVLFTVSVSVSFDNANQSDVPLDKEKLNVVIDLGHGGSDHGVQKTPELISEVEIINNIGQYLRNMESNVNLIFTRKNDEQMALKARCDLANNIGADLLLSLHVNENSNELLSGIEVYYSNENNKSDQSMEIGNHFVDKLKFRKGANASSLKNASFIVLKNTNCPAVVLEIGFLSNKQDLNYLSQSSNQKNLAEQIVSILEQIKK
jgi:N-acetylmuramoyl-L-alanine amidase